MNDAALRYELAGELGNLIWDRVEIVGLVQAHGGTIKVADLPEGNARTLWTYVLVELSNRCDVVAIKALLAAASTRSKRVDWSRYASLASVSAATAAPGNAWSHLTLELRWVDEHDNSKAISRVASGAVMVEAAATLQWAGDPPPDPEFALELSPLFGGSKRLDHKWKRAYSSVQGVATWSTKFPVQPVRFATRRICARAADRRASRYLLGQHGHFAALALWLLLVAFVVAWLAPLGMPVSFAGLGIWAVMFGFGWLLPRFRELLGALSWITRAWEVTWPLVAALTAATMLVPHLIFKVVINRSAEEVRVNGEVVEPTGRRTLIGRLDLSSKKSTQCICPIDLNCRCDDDPVRFVTRFEIQCRNLLDAKCADVQRITISALTDGTAVRGKIAGDVTAPLDWPAGFEPVQFERAAFAAQMKLTSGAHTFELTNVRVTDRAPPVIPLSVLFEPHLTIAFADGSALRCVLPSRQVLVTVGVVDVSPSVDFALDLGGTTSRWRAGTIERSRACLAPAKVASLELDHARRGQRIGLPRNLGIERVQFGSDLIACTEPERLRVVEDKNSGRVALPFPHSRIDDSLIVTCSAAGIHFGGLESPYCTLGDDSITCDPPRPRYEGPCTLTSAGGLEARYSNGCRMLSPGERLLRAIELRFGADRRGWVCTTVFDCTGGGQR